MKIASILLLTLLTVPAGFTQTTAQAQEQIESQAQAAEPLNPEEEQELAERQETAGPEVKGGALSNLHLTYIVIALAAAVLVLVLK